MQVDPEHLVGENSPHLWQDHLQPEGNHFCTSSAIILRIWSHTQIQLLNQDMMMANQCSEILLSIDETQTAGQVCWTFVDNLCKINYPVVILASFHPH